MGFFSALKQVAKDRVRPSLIPVVRLSTRYALHRSARRIAWRYVVEPFFQYAEHRFVAKTKFGAAISGSTVDLIQRYIFYFGEWEPNLTEFVASRLREGDVFVDVGANIGYFTLLASTLVGASGKVFAIEASPTIYEHLLDNLRRNRTTNVEAINVAVSDREGSVKMFLASDDNIGSTSIFASQESRYECDIPAKTFDAILPLEIMKTVRLVKIDVEGAEWLVISGMREMLRRAGPDLEIVVELSPQVLKAQGRSVEEVLAIFKEADFFPYRLENDYSARGYMTATRALRPERVSRPISSQTDVVFSRRDVAFL